VSGDRDAVRGATEREPVHRPRVGLLITGSVGVVLAVCLARLPRGDNPLPPVARFAVEEALPRWHLTEAVNAVVYGFRGFDTFGETFLLLAAVVSVLMLTRSREGRRGWLGEEAAGRREQAETDPHSPPSRPERQARRAEQAEQAEDPGDAGDADPRATFGPETPDDVSLGAPMPETAESMTIVVRTAIRVVLPLLTVAGLYLVAWGYSPGGGFPAGAVLAGVGLLVYVGFGRRRIAPLARPGLLEFVELSGAAAIVVIELLGLVLKGSFTANWLPLAPAQTIRSGGVAQLFSVTELVEVGSGLLMVVFALLAARHDWSPDAGRDGARSGDTRGPRDVEGDGR
jgi:multicomponent Na+:H+ antiporter subunit B